MTDMKAIFQAKSKNPFKMIVFQQYIFYHLKAANDKESSYW